MSWSRLTRITAPDGSLRAVKETTYDARLEQDGLETLAAAGAPVPQVFSASEHRLEMEWVTGSADWELLGATLAGVHRHLSDRFGYRRDNVIGPLPQANPWTDSWPEFFVEHRIRPHLGDLPSELGRRLDRLCRVVIPELLEHDQVPSLIHGDLWAGNIVDGAYLIDPAVCYADRELELAFMALFGGIPEAMWRGYEDAWPLDPGWEQRRPILQLYHLLVHVRLFGGGYVALVAERIPNL